MHSTTHSTHSFFWHDYETFGIDTRRDRPAQFAGLRTDADLNEIGEPVMLYCRSSADYLPDPQSCLITGITPQRCQERGVSEREFAACIAAELSEPGTVGVGYNTIRFDDEVTRHLFWRNLIDPYAREWQNGCGRWDLIDVVRLCYALRPEGIVWPRDAHGKPTFKLEDLTRANGIAHEAAHDALSDVRATLALARLIRQHQPKLFDFAFSLHQKQAVLAQMHLPCTLAQAQPFLHISGMFGAERGYMAVMLALAHHPHYKNEIIAWDLAHDPSLLAHISAASLRQRLFTPTKDLPEGVKRLPIKTIHINKSPMVVGHLRTLTPAQAQRWAIDLDSAHIHAEKARALPDLSALWAAAYEKTDPAEAASDVEYDLYGGFLGREDRRRLDEARSLSGPALAEKTAHGRLHFDDPRLPELLFRYRARNFSETLSADEQQRWQQHCAAKLLDGQGGARSVGAFFDAIDALNDQAEDERSQDILGALYDWAEVIAPQG